jgi:hypothetical protein
MEMWRPHSAGDTAAKCDNANHISGIAKVEATLSHAMFIGRLSTGSVDWHAGAHMCMGQWYGILYFEWVTH